MTENKPRKQENEMAENYIVIDELVSRLPAIPGDAVLSQSLKKDDQVDITLFSFAAGQELTEHTSLYLAILEVLKGEGSMTLGTDSVEIKPGSWVYMPPNLPHSLKTKTPLVMLLTLVK
jgi:quercetin dioxygenase-like cupin family protein